MADVQPKQDNNQNTSLFGISGTLGPTYGTAETRPFTLDDTGALRTSGASAGTTVNIATGTQQTLGTVGTVLGVGGTTEVKVINDSLGQVLGKVYIVDPTNTNRANVTAGSQLVTVVEQGTLGLVTRIGNIGTIESGTVTTTLALNTGTITTIAAGTQNTLGTVGTVAGVGIVTRIGNIGTIESGTVTTSLALNTGTITTIAAGTQNTLGTVGTVIGIGTLTGIGALPAHAISLGTVLGPNASAGTSTTAPVQTGGTTATGTVYAFLTDTAGHQKTDIITGTLQSAGTTTGVGVVSNLTNGTVRMSIGTLTTGSLTNLASLYNGSVNLLTGTLTRASNVGTLESGTVQVNPKSPTAILIAHVLGTTGGTTVGTLSGASGAGTKHFVTGLQIVVDSGTPNCFVGFGTGTAGGSVLARGAFPAGGGIMRDFTIPIESGTNSEICYVVWGVGTANVAVNYWKGV